MAVSFQSTDPLEGVITVQVAKADYDPILTKELKKYQHQATFKGFRKGKTPIDLIKKMYGSQLIQEIVENNLQKQLFDHLTAHKMNILGQPLTNREQEPIYYDIYANNDYTFKFDIGYTNEFEVKGLDNTFDIKKVEASQESIDEQLQKLRERMGDIKDTQAPIKSEDLITLIAKEIKDGAIVESGIENEFAVWISTVDKAIQDLFIGKSVGDEVDAAIKSFHPDKDEKFIRERFFSKLDENVNLPEHFRFHVKEVKQNVPAELNQEFYDRAFGSDTVHSEDEAKSKLKEELEKQIGFQAEALLFRDIQDHLLKENNIPLPEKFLKRWLRTQNQNLNDETIETEFPDFALNLHWTLLRDQLVNKYDIKINREDVKSKFRQQIMSYFGGMAMGDLSFMDPTIEKMMQNREQVNKLSDEIMSDKLFDALKSNVALHEVPIGQKDFDALMEQVRKETAERRAKSTASLSMHTHDHDHHDHDHHHHDHDHEHDHHHDHDHDHHH